jgi:large subunit ribosomal protein L9
MKVLLLKDVYKLGRAGDVKRVADGYGRNYLLPQKLAALATPGALKMAEHIREQATAQRSILNNEMGGVADKLNDFMVTFPAKASETGKLYGSITTQMIADAVSQKAGVEINRRQIDSQPVRNLGEHKVRVRLTVDLIPVIKVVVYREGESVAGGGADASRSAYAAPKAAPTAAAQNAQPAEAETAEAEAAAETPASETA